MECLLSGALTGSLGGNALLCHPGKVHSMLHACACIEGRRTGHGPVDRAIHLAHAVMSAKLVLSLWAGEPLPSLVVTIMGCNLTSGPRRGSGDRFCVLLSCGVTLTFRLQGPWPMVGWHATCSGVSAQRCAVANSSPRSTGCILRNAQADGPGRCYRRSWQRWGILQLVRVCHAACCWVFANLPCGSCCKHAMQVLGPSHRRGSLQAAHSTLQQIDYSVGLQACGVAIVCKASCRRDSEMAAAAPPDGVFSSAAVLPAP